MKGSRFLALALLLHAALLFFDLTADPPPWLDASLGLTLDEGWKTYAARNQVLFGAIQPREGLSEGWAWGSPLPTLLWRASFEAFGVSRFSARLPNVLFSLATLALLYALARRVSGSERAANLAAALHLLDFNALMFARLALQETQVAFWLTAALACWTFPGRARLGAAAAPFCLLAAYLSKASALVALPAFALPLLFFRRAEKSATARFATGAVAAFAVWACWAWIAAGHLHWFHSEMAERASSGFSLVKAAIVLENGYFSRSLPLFAGALGGLLLVLARAHNASSAAWIAAAWLAGGLAGFAWVEYRPARYFPILHPAALLLAAEGLSRGPGALRAAFRAAPALRQGCFCLALAVCGFLTAYAALKLIPSPPARGFLAASAAGGGLLAVAVLRYLAGSRAGALQSRWAAPILLSAMGFFAIPYARWASTRTHHLVESGRILTQWVRPGATVGGYEAIGLALESPHFIGDVDNPPGKILPLAEKLRRICPDYLVMSDAAFAELPPDLRAGGRKLRDLSLPPPFDRAGIWEVVR